MRSTKWMSVVERFGVWTLLSLAVVYAADAAGVELRKAHHSDPTTTVPVRTSLAIPQKNGRIEFTPVGMEARSCVRSLFPHLGLAPCWYVKCHTREQINF